MNIDKAIEILSNLKHHSFLKFVPDYLDALSLGIEALKYVQSQYDPDHQMMRVLLPGETLE